MPNDRDPVLLFLYLTVFLFVLSAVVFIEAQVWQECRAFGHSWFYCCRAMMR
jgi:hypothetical protein